MLIPSKRWIIGASMCCGCREYNQRFAASRLATAIRVCAITARRIEQSAIMAL